MTTPVHETQSLLCDLDDDVYVATVWSLAMGRQEIFAILWRKRDDEGWQMRLRLRTDAGTNNPLDDEKKSWCMVFEVKDEVRAAVLAGRLLEQVCSNLAGLRPTPQPKLSRYDIGRWGTDAGEVIAQKPWASMRTETGAELGKA